MKETLTHIYFLKNYLSNFHKCDITIEISKGVDHTFKNSEQLFMYFKARYFKDQQIAVEILRTEEPWEAKKLGRMVRNYKDEEWNAVRYHLMYQANFFKYSQNKYLEDQLLATGNKILVECNPTDLIWAVGLSEDDPKVLDEANWRGQNLLGKVLMDVRSSLDHEKFL